MTRLTLAWFVSARGVLHFFFMPRWAGAHSHTPHILVRKDGFGETRPKTRVDCVRDGWMKDAAFSGMKLYRPRRGGN